MTDSKFDRNVWCSVKMHSKKKTKRKCSTRHQGPRPVERAMWLVLVLYTKNVDVDMKKSEDYHGKMPFRAEKGNMFPRIKKLEDNRSLLEDKYCACILA